MVKSSDIHHISFHVKKAAVMLSVRESTKLSSLRAQLVPALARLHEQIPDPPTDPDDIQLWEDRNVEGGEGDQGIRPLEDESEADMSIKALGWPRWKALYLSFRAEDGSFPTPEYTVPHPDDGDEE